MQLQTRLRKLLTQVDAELGTLHTQATTITERIRQCETLRASLVKGLGESGQAARPAKGKRPAAGTIPGRVLDIVGEFDEAVTMKDILAAKHGAKEHHVTTAVRQLVRDGHLVATGGTTKRRYSLPVKTKGGAQ